MIPGNNEIITSGQKIRQRRFWYGPRRCSICMSFTWFRPVTLRESVEALRAQREWVLCNPCCEALLMELNRSSIRMPVRLRIALGLVAAERAPGVSTEQQFQQEFAWFTRFLLLFALLHLVIFAIMLTVAR